MLKNHAQFHLLFAFFLAALSLHCCEGFSLVVGSKGYPLVAVWGLLIEVASLVVEHGSRVRVLSSCGSRALVHRFSSCSSQA